MADWTEAELAALRRAYASGTTRVSYDGDAPVEMTLEPGSATIQDLTLLMSSEGTLAGYVRDQRVGGLAILEF